MASEHDNRGDRTGALERLFVYWLVSTLLLVLCCAAVVVYTYGALTRQADAVADMQVQIESLEEAVEGLRQPPRTRPDNADNAGQSRTPGRSSPIVRRDPPPESDPTPPADAVTPRSRSNQDELASQLRMVASKELPQLPGDVRDVALARQIIQQTLAEMGEFDWPARTWLRLALVARLVERDAAAETFARRAAVNDEPPLEYLTVSARALLARERVAEALPLAEQLAERTAPSPAARVLLASALLRSEQPGAAAEVLTPAPPVDDLLDYDRLTLARTLLALQRWDALEAALGDTPDWSREWRPVASLLRAVLLSRAGETVTALAALDYLAAHAGDPGATDWVALLPDAYEIEVWRGVTLMQAQQYDDARTALMDAASRAPGRPAAHYQLGMLALRTGETANAESYFENAVACAARMAPAWEALGLVALNANDVEAALASLQQAVEINPYRASTHFLVALAEAKRSEREAAAEALRRTFALDVAYVDEARAADVLLRLFTPEELDALAHPDREREGAAEAAEV